MVDVAIIETIRKYTLSLVEELWITTAAADNRIEPIPCGEREWETEEGRPILDIARREGIVIAAW